jgi:signal peptidase I
MIGDLNEFSTTDLEKELERRKTEQELPIITEYQNWSPIIQYALKVRDSINNGRWDDDYLDYMYDKVMITVFGSQYSAWEKYKDLRH